MGITIRGTLTEALLSGGGLPRLGTLSLARKNIDTSAVETGEVISHKPIFFLLIFSCSLQSSTHAEVALSAKVLAKWKAVEMFKVRFCSLRLCRTILFADSDKLHSDDRSDRLSGCRLGTSSAVHGGGSRSA